MFGLSSKSFSSFVIAVALALSSYAAASVVVAESWEQMARGAHSIVRGRVANQQAFIDEAGRVYTEVELEVTEAIKGEVGPVVRLREAGGAVGATRQDIAGSPRFSVGQDTLIFLEPAGESQVWLVRSKAAGKIDFEKGVDGKLRAQRQLAGLTLFAPKSSEQSFVVGRDEDLGVAEAFLAQIRSVVAGK